MTHLIHEMKFYTACGIDCYKYRPAAITDQVELVDCLNCKRTQLYTQAKADHERTTYTNTPLSHNSA